MYYTVELTYTNEPESNTNEILSDAEVLEMFPWLSIWSEDIEIGEFYLEMAGEFILIKISPIPYS